MPIAASGFVIPRRATEPWPGGNRSMALVQRHATSSYRLVGCHRQGDRVEGLGNYEGGFHALGRQKLLGIGGHEDDGHPRGLQDPPDRDDAIAAASEVHI